MSAERILVLGAGELGLSIIGALSAYIRAHESTTVGTRLTVLLRESTFSSKPALVDTVRSLGAGTETGDVAALSVPELAALFSRYTTVISCNGMTLPAGSQLKLLDAVLLAVDDASGSVLRRYVPWQFGMDFEAVGRGSAQDLFDEQIAVRERLRGLRDDDTSSKGRRQLDWRIFSTGLFMSFLFLQDFGVVDVPRRTVRALGSWDNEITLTVPRDIGPAVAEGVFDPPRENVVYIAGDTVSYARIAELVEERYGAGFTRELWDSEALRRRKEEDGDVGMYKYRDTFAQGRGVSWDKKATFSAARGLDMMDLKTYLRTLDDDGQEVAE
ncbi:hypothetical protein Micbo1qcDRAFT_126122 [Microdochium bolleyi]|uniref:Uncharacterized protein n=1 Tax=Microdochium bolleyi TaxID=196109 RepID=A0A136INL2_9PEZI|nr:hypothetical protein Micbo1qcDRAFT_126122 [Microdochium bolleyi]